MSFVLKARSCERWTARCLGHASRRLREKAVGLGTDDGGFGSGEAIENTSGEWFECDLDRADGRRWQVRLSKVDSIGGPAAYCSTSADQSWRASKRRTGSN